MFMLLSWENHLDIICWIGSPYRIFKFPLLLTSIWVCAEKHTSCSSDCVRVVVTAVLKIKEHALRGNTHVCTHAEETPPLWIFVHKRKCMNFIWMDTDTHRNATNSIKYMECMNALWHRHRHKLLSISFKWGIGCHGNRIRLCWSHGTRCKMGNHKHFRYPTYKLFASYLLLFNVWCIL